MAQLGVDNELDSDTLEHLRRIGARRRMKFKIFVGFFVLVGLSMIRYVVFIALPAAIASWVAMMYFIIDGETTVCPRCKKAMFYKGLWRSSFSDACLHCGLRIDQVAKRT